MSEFQPCSHADIADAIRCAAPEVFSTMLSMDLTAVGTTIGPVAAASQSGIIALLGLTGERAGSGLFSCEPAFGCRIASQMLMAEYDAVDDDVLDAIAEIANMIVGNIKNMLELKLGPMGLSTPTLVFGGDFATRIVGNPDRITVRFACGDDIATVQVVIAPKNARHSTQPHHPDHLAMAG